MVELIQFSARAPDGSVCYRQSELIALARAKAQDNPGCIVILHIVCGSKTGLLYPSFEEVKKAQQELKGGLLVVVDACQLRCRLSVISEYVRSGFMVLVTGSKFFTGPPFSGAVLIPPDIANEIEDSCETSEYAFPSGLSNYLSPHEIPPEMPRLQKCLMRYGGVWANFPLTMRWHCALSVMEKYQVLEVDTVSKFNAFWVSEVRGMIEASAPYLQLLSVDYESDDTALGYKNEMLGNVNSIISITVNIRECCTFRSLSFDELKRLFEILASGEVCVLLGQPVKLSSEGGRSVIRIALGADMVVAALGGVSDPMHSVKAINRILEDDKYIVSRLLGIAKSWSSETALEQRMLQFQKDFASELSIVRSAFLPPCTSASTTTSRVSHVVQGYIQKYGTFPNVALLYDLDAIDCAISDIRLATSSHHIRNGKCTILHCFAMKAAPVSFIAHYVINSEFGIEAASIMEVKHAIQLGCPPNKIVFDSPCKTCEEIHFALSNGVNINANSWNEVDKISTILKSGCPLRSAIGIRINPLVGKGDIDLLSTATDSSKFGVPMNADEESELRIIEQFRKYSFLTMIMCHVGSQGMSLSTLAQGAIAVTR